MPDYTTQDKVEKYLGTTYTPADTTIALYISHVSAYIDQYCNQDFAEHNAVIEYYDGKGKGHNQILLGNYPVTAITDIQDDGQVLTEDTHFVWYADGRVVRVSSGYEDADNTYWKKKRKGIKVTYDYGYSTAPLPVEQAATIMVANLIKIQEKHEESGTVRSITAEGIAFSYELLTDAFTPQVERLLKPLQKPQLHLI